MGQCLAALPGVDRMYTGLQRGIWLYLSDGILEGENVMFSELAQSYQLPFKSLTVYPSASDRTGWQMPDQDWREESLALGRSCLHYSYPQITAGDFLDFSRTGNRVRYEDKYFERRRALDALVLAECIADTGEFMDDIVNGVFLICEESGWQLPPHNSYIRDTPQLPLPDAVEPVLDLFACETGSILAAVSYLLGEKLDPISPFVRKRIQHEINNRIIRPYLERHFWWMGNGKEPMNNWTIWCTQNVLLSVFLTETEDEIRRKVFLKACKSVDYFLAEYGEDGCCDEGALYYRHAGLCLFNTLEILNAVTGDHFAGMYQETKIQNIASYIMNVHVQDKYYVNFADCSPVAGRCSAREFLFARRTGNKEMMQFAAEDFLAGLPDTLLLPAENNLYYRMQHGFAVKEIRFYAKEHSAPVKYQDIYYPSAGVFITRDDTYFLSVKAGDNGDSHNHNDTGSFTVYKNGLPLFIDVGVETYTRKTFSKDRYSIWTMQSAYHNLPTVNGCMQKDGEEYGASNAEVSFREESGQIQMDISSAYPEEAGLDSYIRKAVLTKGKEIRIKDTFCFSGKHTENTVVLSLMTYDQPVLVEQAETLSFLIGESGALQVSGGSLLEIEAIPVTDPRLQTAWQHEIYRILIKNIGTEFNLTIC